MIDKDSSEFAIETQAYYPGQAYNTPAMMQLAALVDIPGAHLLDIGCGDGQLLKILSERFPSTKYYGLTVSHEECVACGDFFDIHVGDMHRLPWEDSSMDTVISRHSLEHSISPLSALFEINRVLRLDGRLYVVVPSPVSEWVVKWKDHFSVLPKSMWEKLFDDSGFAIEYFEEGSWLASFSMQEEPELRFVLRKTEDIKNNRLSSENEELNDSIKSLISITSNSIAPIVEKKIVVVLHNLVLFDAIRPILDHFSSDVKILIPKTDNAEFEQMAIDTAKRISDLGFLVESTTLPADVSCEVELSPYTYSSPNFPNVRNAKWRVRFMYGLAKEAWNFSLRNNAYYDFVLAYGSYDCIALSAYTTPITVGNLKISPIRQKTVQRNRPTLLYLPTYGPTSSIEAVCEKAEKIKAKYYVIVKAHHGTSYFEPDHIKQLSEFADEFYDHATSISDLLNQADVVLSDGSGAIFDAIAARVPVAIFQAKVLAGLRGTISLEEQLIRDHIIPATKSPHDLLEILDAAINQGVKHLETLRCRLFAHLGEDAARVAISFLTDLLADPDKHSTYAIARRNMVEQLTQADVERNARHVAERQLDETYRRLTDQLLKDVNVNINLLRTRDELITSLNQTLLERDGQLASLNQALLERDGQLASLNQALLERDGQLASLNQALLERDGQLASLNQALLERDGQLASLNQAMEESNNQIEGLNQAMADKHSELMKMSDWAYGMMQELQSRRTTVFQKLRAKVRSVKHKIRIALARSVVGDMVRYARDKRSYRTNMVKLDVLKQALNENEGKLIITFPIITWDFRWQRPQHIVSRLRDHGFSVLYLAMTISPLGRRFRGVNEAGSALQFNQLDECVHQIWLNSVGQINVYTDAIEADDLYNISLGLEAALAELKPGSIKYLLQFPGWWPVAERLKSKFGGHVIFDCMDDHSGFTTNTDKALETEHELIQKADLVISSSELLEERCKAINARTIQVKNGTEFEHFANPKKNGELDYLTDKPIIGYYGAISDWFEMEIVAYCAKHRPDWNFVLIGSTFGADLTSVSGLTNVHFLGEKPYKDLPGYLAYFDVCTIPFKIIPLTLATNPVKFYEYLSAGKPVVSVCLPELIPYADDCYLAQNPEEFLQQLEKALVERSNSLLIERRLKLAQENSWDSRALSILQALN